MKILPISHYVEVTVVSFLCVVVNNLQNVEVAVVTCWCALNRRASQTKVE